MTSSATEWPSTPVPEPIKQLISRFFILGDTPTAEAGRELGEKVFTSDGQIVVNKRVIAGTAGMPSITTRCPYADNLLTFSESPFQPLGSRDKITQACRGQDIQSQRTGDDLMLIGSVMWDFNDGSSENGVFAARALIHDGGSREPKLKLYHGWAVRDLENISCRFAYAARRIYRIS